MPFGPTPTQDDYFTALRGFMLLQLPAGIEIVQAQDNRVSQPAGSDFVTINEVGRRRLSTNVTTYADCAFDGTVTGSTLTVTAMHLGAVQIGNRLLGAGVQAGTVVSAQSSGSPGGIGVYALSVAQQSPISGVPLATGEAMIAQPTEVTVQVDVYGPASGENTGVLTTLLRDGYAALWFQREGWADKGIGILDVGEPRQMAFIDGEQQYEDRFSFDVKLQVNQVTSPAQDFADSIAVTMDVADGIAAGADATTVPALRPGQSVEVSGATTSAGGFGTIDYSDLDAAQTDPVTGITTGIAVDLPAGQWVRLTRNASPSQANFNLPTGFWAGFTFWDGQRFYARAVGDLYLFKFTFTVIPTQRMSGLSFSVRPNDDATFEFGPEPIVLSVDAGEVQTGSETFFEQVRTRFSASGATLYVLSTTGATLTQFSPEIAPLGHA